MSIAESGAEEGLVVGEGQEAIAAGYQEIQAGDEAVGGVMSPCK
jgi:hypothetical protein